jgi:hypothetical protein
MKKTNILFSNYNVNDIFKSKVSTLIEAPFLIPTKNVEDRKTMFNANIVINLDESTNINFN